MTYGDYANGDTLRKLLVPLPLLSEEQWIAQALNNITTEHV